MSSAAYCLDSSVLVKILVPEEGSDEATALLRHAIQSGCRIIAPAFAWAEVGTVLRKKVKAELITQAEADTAWARFMSLDIAYINDPMIPTMAWFLSQKHDLPTIYDASFLAVCDSVKAELRGAIEFWTADREFVRSLGYLAPPYVRLLHHQE